MSRIQVDNIFDKVGTGAPTFPAGLTGTTGSFTGNVSIGGTLSYEDVTNIDSIGIITARSGVDASGANVVLGLSGGSSDDRLKFHTSEIYQDTSSFKIISNTGGIVLRGGGTNAWSNASGAEDYIVATENGSVDLYYDNSKKFETTNTGVTVTGAVSDSIGPLRRLGVNAQSGAYAFVVGDAGKIIRSSGSGAALTLNQNIFTAGDMISVFNVGSGNNTVVQGSGVTLYNTADAATGTRTIAAKGMCTIVCTASNEFAISGSQLT